MVAIFSKIIFCQFPQAVQVVPVAFTLLGSNGRTAFDVRITHPRYEFADSGFARFVVVECPHPAHPLCGAVGERRFRIVRATEDSNRLDAVLPQRDGVNNALGNPHLVTILDNHLRRLPPKSGVRPAEILLAYLTTAVGVDDFDRVNKTLHVGRTVGQIKTHRCRAALCLPAPPFFLCVVGLHAHGVEAARLTHVGIGGGIRVLRRAGEALVVLAEFLRIQVADGVLHAALVLAATAQHPRRLRRSKERFFATSRTFALVKPAPVITFLKAKLAEYPGHNAPG